MFVRLAASLARFAPGGVEPTIQADDWAFISKVSSGFLPRALPSMARGDGPRLPGVREVTAVSGLREVRPRGD
jgi:hypothetical protein